MTYNRNSGKKKCDNCFFSIMDADKFIIFVTVQF